MSNRYFVISLTAMALALVYTNGLYANPLYWQTLDLTQLNNDFHGGDEAMALSQLDSLTLLSADHNGNSAAINMRSASQGVAVMQDRVYFSPAPYSAPQLQLLPNLLQQRTVTSTPMADMNVGGQGAFGVVNYQSVEIGERFKDGSFQLEGSADADLATGFTWGLKQKQYGMLVAANYQQDKGDADFLNDADAEHQATDILFKMNASSLMGARNPQQTEFSYQFIDDDSYRSALGLTVDDWLQEPSRLYSATALDNQLGRHHKYQLSHRVNLAEKQVMTDFYYQSYAQRLNQVNLFDGHPIDIATLLSMAAFDLEPSSSGAALGMLSQDNDYSSFGAQTLSVNHYGDNQVSYSARYHTDKAEIRLGEAGALWQADRSIDASDSAALLAYIDDASALTAAIDSLLYWQGMQLKLALAYEHVSVERELKLPFGDLGEADFSDSDWMPQFGVLYDAGDWRFSTDIRRAWAAASAGNLAQEAQVSLHYQVSAQYERNGLKADLRAYVQEFDNMHVDCTSYSMCSDIRLAIQENISDVLTLGVELGVDYRWIFGDIELPFGLNYQYLNAEYQENSCTDIQGCVLAGAKLAWLPEQQWHFSTGIEYAAYRLNLNARYQSARDLSQFGAQLQTIDSQWRLDLATAYQFDNHHQIYIRCENLLDESLVTTASNSGIRAENGRISYLGYQWRF